MLPGDRLVCAFVDQQAVGEEFKTWLLHVTIVPWFRLPDTSDSISQGLLRALKTIGPFVAVADGEALFGPHKNRHVRLLQEPTPFTRVEEKVRTYLHKKRALLIDETTKRAPQFRPHVTMQGGSSLRENDVFRCERLYIVEQKGHYKKIVNEVKLHGQAKA